MNSGGGISLAKNDDGQNPIPDIEDLPAPYHYATAWQRFWSKNFDLLLLSLPLGFVIAYFFPNFFLSQLENDPSGRLFGLLILPLVFVVDSTIQSVFGGTIARALIGIRVETIDRQRLDIGTALNRAFRVWFYGSALGIPIATLFTYKANFDKLKRGDLTSWDEELGTRVRQVNTSSVRTWFVAILTIVTFFGLSILDRVQNNATPDIAASESLSDLNSSPDVTADAEESTSQAALTPEVDPIEVQLRKAAADLKPEMVDDITRLEGARVEGRRFIYDYSILRRDVTDDGLREYVRSTVRQNLCTNADSMTMMRDYQVTYSFNYLFPNAASPIIEDIRWEDCAA